MEKRKSERDGFLNELLTQLLLYKNKLITVKAYINSDQ